MSLFYFSQRFFNFITEAFRAWILWGKRSGRGYIILIQKMRNCVRIEYVNGVGKRVPLSTPLAITHFVTCDGNFWFCDRYQH